MCDPLDPLSEPPPRRLADKLADLAHKVPGYGGYLDRDARRDADKQLRLRVAAHLNEAIAQLQTLAERLSRAMELDAIGIVDRAISRVREVQAQVEHADYGATSVFSLADINADRLGRIYDHDLRLLDLADAVVQTSHALAAAEKGALVEGASVLESALKGLENHLVARRHLMTSID